MRAVIEQFRAVSVASHVPDTTEWRDTHLEARRDGVRNLESGAWLMFRVEEVFTMKELDHELRRASDSLVGSGR